MRIILSLCLLLALVACHSSSKGERAPTNIGVDVEPYLKWIPSKQLRQGMSSYAKKLGLAKAISGNGTNSGLVAYNFDLLENNKCFSRLVSHFYTDIAKHDLKYLDTLLKAEKGRFAHYALDVSTENTDVEAGWLWKAALKMANGNGNLAMNLIGFCGHDNMAHHPSVNGKEVLIPFANKLVEKKYNKIKAEYYTRMVEYYSRLYPGMTPEFKKKDVERRLADIRASEGIRCPGHNSAMLTQGALGKETLLPKDIKNYVAKSQAPNMGPGYLPGKYYHVVGGAFAACSLVQGGMLGPLITKAQTLAIANYRMGNMCGAVAAAAGQDQTFSKPRVRHLINLTKRFKENPVVCANAHNDNFSGNPSDKEDCQLLSSFNYINREKLDYKKLRRMFDRRRHAAGAAKLFRKYVIGGQSHFCRSPVIFGTRIQRMRETLMPGRCASLNAEDCKGAKDVLRTWHADMIWSGTQHRQGADFARKHCSGAPDYDKEKLEELSCQALQALQRPEPETTGVEP